AITDTGVGISAEDLPKIFKEFFHKDLSGQGNDPGNGLGLKIAQSIVVRHQGSIEVKSIVGQGSTFIITLPLL
ncbi:MAG: HAMP domain-containing sensor histidine kinase, partial [Candidatus Omnitrophica bacterium]|nr:HAMP domain-containing sensor histidine kinase [Candidatus Omnitrophota bacterium]